MLNEIAKQNLAAAASTLTDADLMPTREEIASILSDLASGAIEETCEDGAGI